jgi:hypothetical protein
VAQSLIDIMGMIRGGFAMNQAGKKLAEVTQAVKATGKKGSITITIEVEADKTDENIVTVKPKITAKIPEKGFKEGIFYLSADGKLSLDDPKQAEMFAEKEAQGVADLAAQKERLAQIGRGNHSG